MEGANKGDETCDLSVNIRDVCEGKNGEEEGASVD